MLLLSFTDCETSSGSFFITLEASVTSSVLAKHGSNASQLLQIGSIDWHSKSRESFDHSIGDNNLLPSLMLSTCKKTSDYCKHSQYVKCLCFKRNNFLPHCPSVSQWFLFSFFRVLLTIYQLTAILNRKQFVQKAITMSAYEIWYPTDTCSFLYNIKPLVPD